MNDQTKHPEVLTVALSMGAMCETHTLKDALHGAVTDGDIYIIRDGETVFYVGMSEVSALGRVAEHYAGIGNRDLWQVITDNQPDAMGWHVDLIRVPTPDDIRRIEAVLIARLCPCCNTIFNQHPAAIPSKYTPHRQSRDDEHIAFMDSMAKVIFS